MGTVRRLPGRGGQVLALGLIVGLLSAPVHAEQLCPAAKLLPTLTIDQIQDPAVPVDDRWQIFWDNVPISDAQLAQLSGEDPIIDMTREEMELRGPMVYLGLLVGATGAAVSSVGWLLLGGIEQNKVAQTTSLTLALGGMAANVLGMLIMTDAIQRPLEPHLAPTPRHRISRSEVRRLVAQVNRRLYEQICAAVPP